MNGEDWKRLDDRLRNIETNFSAASQQISDMNSNMEELKDHVDQIRISLAREEGAAVEAEKNAAKQGKRAGLLWGGLVSAVITAFGTGLRWLFG